MPGGYDYSMEGARNRLLAAEAEVRTKFPALLKGSSGWFRALKNRLRRTRG